MIIEGLFPGRGVALGVYWSTIQGEETNILQNPPSQGRASSRVHLFRINQWLPEAGKTLSEAAWSHQFCISEIRTPTKQQQKKEKQRKITRNKTLWQKPDNPPETGKRNKD